ncbi:MAG: flavin reductase family protein [Thermoprotei archaeon]|nr:MAG: flavin reductase family protein [Thermoprotei archaeon]
MMGVEMWRKISFREWPYILHPRPVTIVASKFKNKLSAMAASWTMPVSRKPPVVAVAIAKNRFTYELIIKSKEFSLNLLPKEYLEKIQFLGTVSGREFVNKIEAANLTMASAKRIGSPIILESLAILECILRKDIESGDHNIIVGEIIEVYARKEFNILNEETIRRIPLHVRSNKYTSPIGEIIEVE